jgi:tetratricopeptide (TPR) repeat protein
MVFGQSIGHDFTDCDDPDYVSENPHVAHGVTAEGIAWAFTQRHAGNWHPLTWLSHMVDCELYGLRHPGGHHLTNVLLHAATTILLFLVLRQMTGDLWPSSLAAALFAVHPLHVESVAWVAERKDVLSGLFFVLTLAAYVGYARCPFSALRYLTVSVLFALGLLCKPMLVTLPFVLLLLDFWPLGRCSPRETGASEAARFVLPPRVLWEKLPWLALTAASCLATYWAQGTAVISTDDLSLSARVANALVSYVSYLGQFLCPAGLAVFYPHPKDGLPLWQIIGAFLALAAVSAAALAWRRRCPYLLVGWLWYLGMLVPVIGLVQVGSQAMADRYTYLAQIGLYLAVVWGLMDFAKTSADRRWACGAASLLAVAVLGGCAWRQASHWKDSEALWSHAVDCSSDNFVAHNSYGLVLADLGRVEEAMAHFEKALRIRPGYAEAHSNLGAALAARGKFDKAMPHFQTALELRRDLAEVHYNLGVAWASGGQVEKAIPCFEKALEIKPAYAKAHNNLGRVLADRGEVDEAITHFRQAVEIKPGFAEAHNNLGTALAGRGEVAEAIAHYQAALEIRPDLVEARRNLDILLGQRE